MTAQMTTLDIITNSMRFSACEIMKDSHMYPNMGITTLRDTIAVAKVGEIPSSNLIAVLLFVLIVLVEA